jgi:membrane protein DedA with SNARE-associated domain
MIEIFVGEITKFISAVGYLGVFLLMTLESTVFPLPSELVMPFAGFLVARGTFSWWGVIIVSSLGGLVGSLISYLIGYHGRMPFIRKFGKYFLLDEEHLEQAEQWFHKHGGITIFIGRFIPGVRHVIAIPAGIGKMNLWKFSSYTLIGCALWNAFLIWTGYVLEKNWELVYNYTEYIDMFIVFVLIIAITYYAIYLVSSHHKSGWKHFKKK